MSTTFQLRVARALSNEALGRSLDRVSAQLRTRRAEAFASLDDAEQVRDEARRVRLDTLRNLAAQLERFETRLLVNGAQVHWAETAGDVHRIVVGIAAAHRVKRVVKGKSMVSEEVGLNAALHAAGLDVVETDFGEYIVQLAHDQPSHIVAPIVHLSRADVGRVMHQRLDIPLTDDPAALARAARDRLRRAFLDADMGITGANFGVVETGTICLVTNEGNGRMVTSLPRVHVVLMGIEKVVPTMADLDRLLKVLPRSATGQKLTAYTTLINGPRRSGETCGPEALHVVFVDNGRSQALAGRTAEILACIRCGACMNVCPVYTSIGGHAYGDTYPGPVGAVLTPALRGTDPWAELAGASSLCGACRDVCPVRIDIPRMLLDVRQSSALRSPFWMRAAMRTFGYAASRPRLYRLLTALSRRALAARGRAGWIRRLPGPAAAWTSSRDLPVPASTTFARAWQLGERR